MWVMTCGSTPWPLKSLFVTIYRIISSLTKFVGCMRTLTRIVIQWISYCWTTLAWPLEKEKFEIWKIDVIKVLNGAPKILAKHKNYEFISLLCWGENKTFPCFIIQHMPSEKWTCLVKSLLQISCLIH